MRYFFTLLAVVSFLSQDLCAQEINWYNFSQTKHELDSIFDAENYAKALVLAESQVQQLKRNNVYDSLYNYVYKLGRCNWKLKGLNAGYRSSEDLLQIVFEKDRDTLHHLAVLNDMSWFYYETGNDSLCLQTDKLFIETCRSFSKTPKDKFADGYYNLGFDYLAIGNNKLAEENWKMALDILLADPNAKHVLVMKCFNALGTALYRKGDFKGSRNYYNQCLEKAKTIEDIYERNSNVANSYGNLALLSEDEGNYILARQMVEKSLFHRKLAMDAAKEPHLKQQEQDNSIKSYGTLAELYLSIGEVKRSEQLLHLIQEEKGKLLEANDPRRNLVHEQFASLYQYTDRLPEALEHILIFKESCRQHYGEESFWWGFALTREAQIRHRLKELPNAASLFTEAIALFSKLEDEDAGKELASCYRKRALVYRDMNNFDAAIPDLQMALEIYKGSRDETDPLISQCYLDLVGIQLSLGNLDAAILHLDEALKRAEHYKEMARSSGGRLANFSPLLPEIYYTRSVIAEKSNAPDALERAFLDCMQAVDYAKSSQSVVDSDESALLYNQASADIFSRAQDLSHRMFQQTGNLEYAEKLLQLGEENRTVMLRRQLNSFSSIAYNQVPDSILKREYFLQQELRKGEVLADSLNAILELEKSYDALIDKIKIEHPQYYELKYNTSVANLKMIQKELLGDVENLVEYIVSENAIYGVVVTATTNQVIKLNRAGIAESIQRYNKSILTGNLNEIHAHSFQLYKELFEPLRPYLVGTSIYIIPDDELFNLNFETLRMSDTGGNEQYLIQKYTISYLLSATTALQFSRLKRKIGEGVLAIAPGFSDEMKNSYASRKTAFAIFDQDFMQRIQQPFAVNTATQVATMFRGTAYTGMQATEANFRSKATDYGIIHFGTHTEINNLSPLMSRLILNPALTDSTDDDDGYLHAYEIYNLQLRAELAVLTACETGIGKQENGEGVMSLAHGFAYAGCPSVVMSVWQIDEKTSAEIIEDFYAYLAKGMPKNEALRAAKLQFMEEHPGELSAPYYWAGMVLLGDTDVIQSANAFNWWWLIAIVGGLVLGLVIMRNLKKRKVTSAGN